jgi:hypothetical protein
MLAQPVRPWEFRSTPGTTNGHTPWGVFPWRNNVNPGT